MENQIPFNRMLGLKVHLIENGYCEMILPFQSQFIGDPVRQALHGGVISSLIDTAGGLSCWTMVKHKDDRISTVDLRVDYLQKGPAKDLICKASVVRMGNRVAVSRMEVFEFGDESAIVATGQAVYNVSSPSSKNEK